MLPSLCERCINENCRYHGKHQSFMDGNRNICAGYWTETMKRKFEAERKAREAAEQWDAFNGEGATP
jgi:hypothetical protein